MEMFRALGMIPGALFLALNYWLIVAVISVRYNLIHR